MIYLIAMALNCMLEYAIRKVDANHGLVKLNGALQLLAYAGGVTVLVEHMYENISFISCQ